MPENKENQRTPSGATRLLSIPPPSPDNIAENVMLDERTPVELRANPLDDAKPPPYQSNDEQLKSCNANETAGEHPVANAIDSVKGAVKAVVCAVSETVEKTLHGQDSESRDETAPSNEQGGEPRG